MSPAACATTTDPSTVHGLPWFTPKSQTLFLQRGHTWPGSVRKTSERRSTVTFTAPVDRSAVPVITSPGTKRFATHTGTLAARSGRGGPNVSVLIESAPVGPHMPQTGFVLLSHRVRQSFSCEPPTTGKLCEVPVHP